MTVWIKGPEALEVSIANTLTTNINAQLDNIWSAWGDIATVPKTYPAMVYAGIRQVIPEYPAIVVTSVEGEETADGAPNFGEQTHVLDISAIVASDDLHVLDVQTKRYLVAIWEVIKQHQPLDGTVSGLAGVTTKRYGRSQVYTKDGLLYRACGWRVEVFTLETV